MSTVSKSSQPGTPPQKTVWQRVWAWFLTTVGPRHFYQSFMPWIKPLGILAAFLISCASVWGLAIAPTDYLQHDSYRIIFIHVPAASLALSLYIALAVLSVISLVWKIKLAQWLAQSITSTGLLFCILSLITGAIWGKPTWGAYWVWDARLTSMLILAFLYIGVIALYQAFADSSEPTKAASILAVVGVVNLPIIKYSVIWWNTLHQASTFSLTAAPKMPPSMYLPLVMMLLGFYILAAAIILYQTQTLILKNEYKQRWVKAILGHKLNIPLDNENNLNHVLNNQSLSTQQHEH